MLSKPMVFMVNGNIETKIGIQQMVFPEGILYDYENDIYRTTRVNTLFSLISSYTNIKG